MIPLVINLGERSYPVFIGRETLPELGLLLKEAGITGSILMVTDATVSGLYGESCRKYLESAGYSVTPFIMEPGEESKNTGMVGKVYDAAVEAGLDRSACVLALGGGVVGDLAGFAAATYLRGISFAQVPTTLLAQVDSSVGGKTGVNHPRGKNLIGAFHQPRLVFIDVAVLNSLPEREYRAGLAEVVKYGLIGDRQFFEWLEQNFEGLLARDPASLIYAVKASVQNKAAVVEADEKESGKRKILNLGHTFGHALEAAAGYKHYLHGEAVLIGMDMAVSLSEKLGLLDGEFAGRIKKLLRLSDFAPPPSGLTAAEVIQKLVYDKKREGEKTVFVLPSDRGEAVLYADPPENLIREVISRYIEK
jgi:3-dehydroquinate synthase